MHVFNKFFKAKYNVFLVPALTDQDLIYFSYLLHNFVLRWK